MKDSLKSIFPYVLIIMGFAIAIFGLFQSGSTRKTDLSK